MKTLISFILIFFAISAQTQECTPSNTSCEFYDCVESKFQCGENGYFNKFAKKNCDLQTLKNKNISQKLSQFIKDVRLCLQKEVSELPTQWSCKAISDAAIDSHLSCLIESGYCDLSTKEIFILSSGMDNLLEISGVFGALSLGLSIAGSCSQQKNQIRNQGEFFSKLANLETRSSQEILSSLNFKEHYVLPLSDSYNSDGINQVIPYFIEYTYDPLLSEEQEYRRQMRNFQRRNLWVKKYL